MASKEIILAGTPYIDEQRQASAAITPGHLIEIDTGKYRKHATAAGNAAPIFALNRDELGHDIDIDYAANDYVKAAHFAPGDKVNAWLASGQNMLDGAFVESAGDGTVRALATDAATDDTQRVSVVGRVIGDTGALVALTRWPIQIV